MEEHGRHRKSLEVDNIIVYRDVYRDELSEQPAMIQSYSNEVVYPRVSLPGMDIPFRVLIIASLVVISTAFTACGDRGDKGTMPAKGAGASAAATPCR